MRNQEVCLLLAQILYLHCEFIDSHSECYRQIAILNQLADMSNNICQLSNRLAPMKRSGSMVPGGRLLQHLNRSKLQKREQLLQI